MDRQGPRHRRARDEQGASLVEFALILPVFAMLMLGTLTGGLAYNRNLAITSGAREGSRYAATLPRTGLTQEQWATRVADVAVAGSDGELDPNDSGREVCVAFISTAETFKVEFIGSNPAVTTANTTCYSDGLSLRRVQVVARRTTTFEAMAFSRDVDLVARSISRYEAG